MDVASGFLRPADAESHRRRRGRSPASLSHPVTSEASAPRRVRHPGPGSPRNRSQQQRQQQCEAGGSPQLRTAGSGGAVCRREGRWRRDRSRRHNGSSHRRRGLMRRRPVPRRSMTTVTAGGRQLGARRTGRQVGGMLATCKGVHGHNAQRDDESQRPQHQRRWWHQTPRGGTTCEDPQLALGRDPQHSCAPPPGVCMADSTVTPDSPWRQARRHPR